MHKNSWPTEFQYYELEEICRPKQWPTISQEQLTDAGFPVYGANGIIGFFEDYTHEFPTVAITCRGSTCGKVTLTRAKSYITGNAMALDNLDHAKVAPRFLYYCLAHSSLDECITGSAQPQIIGSALRHLGIYVPPISEQHQIVRILNTLDNQIRRTEEIIFKLKKIKEGLVTDLFTRGIGENGELRPSSAQAPHLYNDSPIGWIPNEWETTPIAHFASITTGSRDTQDRSSNGPYPFFVRSQNIEGIDSYSFDCTAVLTAGDGVGTGKVFHYIEGKFDAHQRVYVIHKFKDAIYPRFFFEYFRVNFIERVQLYSAKNTVDSVRMAMIADMLCPIPPLEEQCRITYVLERLDARLESERQLVNKLRRERDALMEDLLTGRVRVTPLLEEAGQAVG